MPRGARPAHAWSHPGRALGLTQIAALAGCLVALALSELSGLAGDLFAGEARRRERRSARRERQMARVSRVLGRLKGAFAKAGQFAALRYDALPPALRRPLAELHDRVPPIPFGSVRAVVESELGAPLEACFQRFEREPLAAASIAQVHRARLPGGEEVAVKVQYPWLASSLAADLFVTRLCVRPLVRRLGRGVDHGRLLDEFAAGLREELDFEREARVAQEIAANLAGDASIVVPRVFSSHSRRRVLTLAYHRGLPVSRDVLTRVGVDPAAVLDILARAYARQIFVDGLFHADPHPGNLFVLDEPEGAVRPRVLFVDFGLSRRLDPALRAALRRGIYALLQRNPQHFVSEMGALGMIAQGAQAGVQRSVDAMFGRIAAEGPALALSGRQVLALKDEAKLLLEQTRGLQLPNDLLLYAKTLSYLLALGQELAPQVDLVRLCVPYLLRFLAEKEEAAPASARAASPAGG